jgi:hypothetical protein
VQTIGNPLVRHIRRWEGRAMGGPRMSIAGLMTVVAVVALDCATFIYGTGPTDRSLGMAIVILGGVLPVINVVGVAMLLVLQPSARR